MGSLTIRNTRAETNLQKCKLPILKDSLWRASIWGRGEKGTIKYITINMDAYRGRN